jgi:mxaJ protein
LKRTLASLALVLCAVSATSAPAESPSSLRVCADPNNLPFSNRAGQGFENKIIELVAKDLGVHVTYVWWAQRRGYVRNTLNDSKCDVWPGMATGVDMAATSRPYYRSTYVFVTRADSELTQLTLDDPRLRGAEIGVQMIGNDSTNTPPAHAIASRGIIDNVRGYMVYGDYTHANPPAAIIHAVADRQIDVGLVWGPLAGYFVNRSRVPLRIEAVTPAEDPRWPMAFDISMGVSRKNHAMLDRINESLAREQSRIAVILKSFHVPLAESPAAAPALAQPTTSTPATRSP